MKTTLTGNNAYPKHGLAGQNNGTPTDRQLKQSLNQRGRKFSQRSTPAMYPQKQFKLLPWTHASRINFRRNKYAPVIGSKMRVIHAGGTRIGHFDN